MAYNWKGRKEVELRSKFEGLKSEFKYWIGQADPAITKDPERRFRIHSSQIHLVVNKLEILSSRIMRFMQESDADEQTFLDTAGNTEALILGVHRLWGFFRTKFTQRLEERYRRFLAVADQLAWVCYKPFQEALYGVDSNDPRCKQPPLVYFNGGASPFAMVREVAFEAELVPGESLSGPFSRFLDKLPVPIIGIPWHQVDHLPDILVIAHEVGHVVEEDFRLKGVILDNIGGLFEKSAQSLESPQGNTPELPKPVDRCIAWKEWASEVFADLFGCAACGPAYVSTLSDFLVCDPERSLSQLRSSSRWGDYPATDLRMQLNFAGLRELGFVQDAQRLQEAWLVLVGPVRHGAFGHDVPNIVHTLLRSPLASLKRSVADVLPALTLVDWENRTGVFEGIDQGRVDTAEARILLNAVRSDYDNAPEKYLDPERTKNLVEKVHQRMEEEINVRFGTAQQRLSQILLTPEDDLSTKQEADTLFKEFRAAVFRLGEYGTAR